MKNVFIIITKAAYKNKALVSIDDISCIFNIRGGGSKLFLKSDPKNSIEIVETVEQVEKLINNAQRK